MKRIVCDTGPLLHLREAGVRDLLSPAGDVHVSIAVDLEIRNYEADWSVRRPAWLHVTQLDSGPALEARSWQQAGLLHSSRSRPHNTVRVALTTDSQRPKFTLPLSSFVLWVIENRQSLVPERHHGIDLGRPAHWIMLAVSCQFALSLWGNERRPKFEPR